MSKSLIHTPEGVRDIYGKEIERKHSVENRLHHTLKTFGYQDIQTPTFEFFDVFGSEIGTTPSRELYKFFDKDGETLVLRPDFTPSMARCAAKYFKNEKLPIRLSYLGNTFTNTSNLQGKLKEVTQLGAELIQDSSVQADAEMIAMVVETLKSAGLEDFQISIGHVEYFRGICSQAGMSSETEVELRDFISNKNYFGAQELLERKGIRKDYISKILKVYDLFGGQSTLSEAKSLVSNERSLDAVERLEDLYQMLCNYHVEKYVSFDLGLLSKYNYYTGIVFKAYTYGVGDAVVKGGRYDRLLAYFGKQAPAIGFVIVVDDLLEALSRQNRKPVLSAAGTLIVYADNRFSDALEIAGQIRCAGNSAELISASENTFSQQLSDIYQEHAEAHLQDQIIYLAQDGTEYRIAVKERTPV